MGGTPFPCKKRTSCSTNVVTSCPAGSTASRPPCRLLFCYFHARLSARAPMRSRIAMPTPLDRKGIQATLHQIIQALAAGHISARRAGVLLYGIQMSLSQAPQAPVPTIPVLKP